MGIFYPATVSYSVVPDRPEVEWLNRYGGVHPLADGGRLLVAQVMTDEGAQFVTLDPATGEKSTMGPAWERDEFPRAISILPGENSMLYQEISVEQGRYRFERVKLD